MQEQDHVHVENAQPDALHLPCWLCRWRFAISLVSVQTEPSTPADSNIAALPRAVSIFDQLQEQAAQGQQHRTLIGERVATGTWTTVSSSMTPHGLELTVNCAAAAGIFFVVIFSSPTASLMAPAVATNHAPCLDATSSLLTIDCLWILVIQVALKQALTHSKPAQQVWQQRMPAAMLPVSSSTKPTAARWTTAGDRRKGSCRPHTGAFSWEMTCCASTRPY